MGRTERTVFISYRRTNFSWALAIFQDLTQHGFDVFIDYTGINSGAFETVILENIKARAHFIVLLTPSALERCVEPGDWLRREIETALEVKRNIIPLMLENFDFGAPGIGSQLTGNLEALKHYNGLRVVPEYFSEGMERLRDKYLSVPLDAVMHDPSVGAQQAAQKEQAAAATAPAVPKTELQGTQSTSITRPWKPFVTAHLGWQMLIVLAAGTIIALAATLIVQRGQFGQSEKDKREAAEDLQWANAVKVISQDSKLTPIALDRFFNSARYGDAAKAYTVQILANSNDEVLFDDLFRAAFTPTSLSVLDHVLKLDRALRTRQEPLDGKSYIAKTDTNDYAKLSDDERKIDRYDSDAFTKICSQLATMLRPQRSQIATVFPRFQRPSGEELDLSQTYIYNCDWSGVDLSGANLDGAKILWVGLRGANLSGITRFGGVYIYHAAWWEAESISPEFLDFLQNDSDSKYKQGAKYGPSYRTFSLEQYAAAINRLKTQKQ